jgi:hypothetical protein
MVRYYISPTRAAPRDPVSDGTTTPCQTRSAVSRMHTMEPAIAVCELSRQAIAVDARCRNNQSAGANLVVASGGRWRCWLSKPDRQNRPRLISLLPIHVALADSSSWPSDGTRPSYVAQRVATCRVPNNTSSPDRRVFDTLTLADCIRSPRRCTPRRAQQNTGFSLEAANRQFRGSKWPPRTADPLDIVGESSPHTMSSGFYGRTVPPRPPKSKITSPKPETNAMVLPRRVAT